MSMDRFRLDGRVALVTGASGALGADLRGSCPGRAHGWFWPRGAWSRCRRWRRTWAAPMPLPWT